MYLVLINIDSDNGLAPVWHQVISWTKAGLLFIGFPGTNFSEIAIKMQKIFIQEYYFENVACKMLAILSRPQ